MFAVILPALTKQSQLLATLGTVLVALLIGIVWGADALMRRLGWSRRTRTLVLAVGLVAFFARPIYGVLCASCMGCDPWWMELLWICVP